MTHAPAASSGGGVSLPPSFRDALRFWTKLGFINFGGPAGQIALMHAELVERRRWISEERFLHALSYCMVLPGPEAQQLAIYVGWLLHGAAGGVVAGTLFVLPSLALLLGLSWLYAAHGTLPAVQAALYGIKPVVIAIIAVALWRIASRSLRSVALAALAILGFVAVAVLRVPFPLVVVGAGLVGFVGARAAPRLFVAGGDKGHTFGAAAADVVAAGHVAGHAHLARRALRILGLLILLWGGPVALLWSARGTLPVLYDEAIFFSKAALVTFGGAYAVLPYVTFAATTTFGWLTPSQMIDGLALGETTPGPLIMVTTFVGFLGAWGHPGVWPPAAAGLAGGVVTTYFTFLFSFFFIFLGAPYVERFRAHPPLAAALTGVSAAIVGVIATLAAFLGAHVFVRGGRVDWIAVTLAALAFWALRVRGWSIHWVVLGGAAAGVVLRLLAV